MRDNDREEYEPVRRNFDRGVEVRVIYNSYGMLEEDQLGRTCCCSRPSILPLVTLDDNLEARAGRPGPQAIYYAAVQMEASSAWPTAIPIVNTGCWKGYDDPHPGAVHEGRGRVLLPVDDDVRCARALT